MEKYLYYITALVFIIVIILILRKTDTEKIDAIARFFKTINPFHKTKSR
jgi:hypothetical protein